MSSNSVNQKISFYKEKGEDGKDIIGDIIIKDTNILLIKTNEISNDENFETFINNLSYNVECTTTDVGIIFVNKFSGDAIEDVIEGVNAEEINKYYSIGYFIVDKIKFDDDKGKEIKLKLTWSSGEDSGEDYITFNILTNDIGKKLSLPLYYRPFYTNAVLLLTPEYMTDGILKGGYKYEISKLSGYWGEAKNENINNEIANHNYTFNNEIAMYNYTFNNEITNFEKVINNDDWTIRVDQVDICCTLKCDTELSAYYKITNLIIKIKNEEIYKNDKDISLHRIGIVGENEKKYESNQIKRGGVNIIITLGVKSPEIDGVEALFTLNVIVREEITSSKTKCYGRLFYSIANGCSIVEQIDENNNIYKLDKVSLSYIDRFDNKSGTFTLKKPFRCYSEMESVKKENTFADDFTGTTQTSRMMMYGITEPFIIERGKQNTTYTNRGYFTKKDGSTKIKITSSNRHPTGEYSENIKTGEWEVTVPYKKYTDNGKENIHTEKLYFKWTWTSDRKYYAKYAKYGYKDYIWLYVMVNNEVKKDDANLLCKLVTDYQLYGYDFQKMNENEDLSKKLYGIIGNINENETKLLNNISFKVSKWLSRAGAKNTDAISFIGEYDYDTTTDIISLERDGVRITEKKDGTNDEVDIEKEDMYKKGNLQAVINDGILNIYTKRGEGDILGKIEDKIIQVINYNKNNNEDEKKPVIFNTSNPLDISLNITEGYPEGEEGNASTIDIGYNNVKFYDDINLGDYWVSTVNDVFYTDPIKKECDYWTNAYNDIEKLDDGDYVRIKNDQTIKESETDESGTTYKKGIYKVVLTTKKDENNNDIEIKELSYYCESIIEKNGLSVQGYSSKNVRYIALGNFGDADTKQTPENINNETVEYKWGNEPENILKSIYEIDVLDGGNADGTTNPQIRYAGLNINDYLGETSGSHSGMRTVKYSGWKGMQTYLKKSNGAGVKLSGVSWNGGGSHSKIDITNILREVYNDASVEKKVPVDSKKRLYVIGICDNYTNLSDDEYNEEKVNMYSIIKPHTSRFSIIKLYKLKNDEQ